LRIDAYDNPNYGIATIDWQTGPENTYKMQISAGVSMLFTALNLYQIHSKGHISASGISPELCTEKRLRRAETATHFNHSEQTISFSTTSNTIPMLSGAQDKASMLIQLAGIGRYDAKQLAVGQEIALQVADEREAHVFQFQVTDETEIETKLGKIKAIHLQRSVRPGAYNSRLEIWLAPSLGWYPVQIRNTEGNGAVTTQTLKKIETKLETKVQTKVQTKIQTKTET